METVAELFAQHGAWLLFGGVLAEQLGLPFPAWPLLVMAGVLVGTGHLTLTGAVAAAITATVLADLIWFMAGRWRGRPVLGLLCRIALEPEACVRQTEDFFRRHGAPSLVVAKFIPGLSTIAPPLAGIVGLSLPLFLMYDAVGAAAWVGSGLGFGMLFSEQVDQALAYSAQATPAVLLGAAVLLSLYIAWKARVRRQLRTIPRMSAETLLHRLESDRAPLLIDVRARAAVAERPGLPGALHLPLDEWDRHRGTIPSDRDLVLYCACPDDGASALAATRLQRMGIKQVWVLRGGLGAWQTMVREEGLRKSLPMHPVPEGQWTVAAH